MYSIQFPFNIKRTKCLSKRKRLNEDDLLINYFNDPKTEILYVSSGSDVSRDILYENELKNFEDDGQIDDSYKYDDNFEGLKLFRVFTTITIESFLVGDKLNININDNYDTVLRTIQRHIKSIDPPDFLQNTIFTFFYQVEFYSIHQKPRIQYIKVLFYNNEKSTLLPLCYCNKRTW